MGIFCLPYGQGPPSVGDGSGFCVYFDRGATCQSPQLPLIVQFRLSCSFARYFHVECVCFLCIFRVIWFCNATAPLARQTQQFIWGCSLPERIRWLTKLRRERKRRISRAQYGDVPYRHYFDTDIQISANSVLEHLRTQMLLLYLKCNVQILQDKKLECILTSHITVWTFMEGVFCENEVQIKMNNKICRFVTMVY
jgi:hypothetical protein